jgi:hypothetical protein
MSQDQIHQQKTSTDNGFSEQEMQMKRSASPPAQLFADPDEEGGGADAMQLQEGPGTDSPPVENGDGGSDGIMGSLKELWAKFQEMFGGEEQEAAEGGEQEQGGPQQGGPVAAAAGAAAGGAAAKKDPPNKFVPVNDRTTKNISDAVVDELNKGVDEVKKFTGVDIGTGFGDTTRNLGQGTKKVGADNFSWHKSGRAVDFDQGLKWVIAKDPNGNDMFFRLYLQANEAGAASAYAKTFTEKEKGNLHYNAMGSNATKKPVVDVTAILEKNGFSRIPAHKGWEKSYNKREWWHYVKDDGLTWYQALRQIYTEEQIVTAMKKLVVDRHNSGGRLAREGFIPSALKAIWDNTAVTKGKLSLYFSIGSHKNCPNIPEDVAAAKAAMIKVGIADGNISTMISAYQVKKGSKKGDGYMTVGGGTHGKLGAE